MTSADRPYDDLGFRRYLAAVERFPVLEREDELRLARRWRRRADQKAADALVQSNLRYVVQIALKYRGYGIRVSDLIEEGNIGLLEAVKRFDPGRKLRFMTYAAFWIRAYILAHVLKQWSMVGVGSSPIESKLFFRLQGARASLIQEHGGEDASIDRTLAERFGTSEERVRAMTQRLSAKDASLDAHAFRDGEATFVDLLVDGGEDPESTVAGAERDEAVRRLLGEAWPKLDDRERLIVEKRLLQSDDGVTLADLGRDLGLSRERVRQLEERVKNKLRGALRAVA